MGKVIEVRFEEIRPSELGVRLDNILGILAGEKKKISGLLAPFKKSEDHDGRYTALDSGNSRMIRLMMAGLKSAKIYLAESDDDTMVASIFPGATDFALLRSNYAIQDRWIECEKNAEEIERQSGIKNYRDYFNKLLIQYPYLESTPAFWNYITTTKGRENFRLPIGGKLDLLFTS